MPNLYELTEELATVIDGGMVVDMDTGEVLFSEENLDALQIEVADKFLACKCFVDSQHAQATAKRELAKQLQEAAKVQDRKAARINAYMLERARAAGGEIKAGALTVKVRKCPASVQILNEAAVPEEFWSEKVTRSVNKRAVKEALDAGEGVSGAALVVNERVEVK